MSLAERERSLSARRLFLRELLPFEGIESCFLYVIRFLVFWIWHFSNLKIGSLSGVRTVLEPELLWFFNREAKHDRHGATVHSSLNHSSYTILHLTQWPPGPFAAWVMIISAHYF